MSVYRAQIAFQMDTALPRDAMTINPHYFSTDPAALAVALKANLIANPNVGSVYGFTIKIYDAQKAPPNYPLATQASTPSLAVTSNPRELSLCLSYYATNNVVTKRGRLYIPAALITGGIATLRPTQAQIDKAMTFGPTLGKNLGTGNSWVVWSRKLNSQATVTNYWCDNEWDIVRSRGMRGTARTLGTIP